MIVLFTDFGVGGPYLGQVQAVLCQQAPGVPVINLMADVPAYSPRAAAYLLAAYVAEFPKESVFLGVVDPGVGTSRRGAVVRVDRRWYVGPDNGLFNVVAMRGGEVSWWDISWRPDRLSVTFHGRDLFAPVAAMLARCEPPPGKRQSSVDRLQYDWPEDLAEVIYIDPYGNAITGVRADQVAPEAAIELNGQVLRRAETFGGVSTGTAFWYKNSSGLVEIAVNCGRAETDLRVHLGDPVIVH